ncbi:MAG TPA: MarR family transcriptional regulator [Roseiflexaceae bacterium]
MNIVDNLAMSDYHENMTLLDSEIETLTPEACATLLMDTVPLVMRAIRGEMRSHRPSDLSVQQFRALMFVRRRPGASLAQVAEHVGLTPPSTSKMIDRLVARQLIDRQILADNRRRVTLNLTPLGESTLADAHAATRARLAELLAALPPDERAIVARAQRALQPVFTPDRAVEPGAAPR